MSALSDSTTTIDSPLATASPGLLSHSTIFPSVIVDESAGMNTSRTARVPAAAAPRPPAPPAPAPAPPRAARAPAPPRAAIPPPEGPGPPPPQPPR